VCAGKDSRIIPKFRKKENITGDESFEFNQRPGAGLWKFVIHRQTK
jgi:hypothetical protein